MGNLDSLEAKFPKDYRVPLLRGIYIKFFTTFDEKYYQQAIQNYRRPQYLIHDLLIRPSSSVTFR